MCRQYTLTRCMRSRDTRPDNRTSSLASVANVRAGGGRVVRRLGIAQAIAHAPREQRGAQIEFAERVSEVHATNILDAA